MAPLQAAGLGAEFAAAVTAVPLARRRPGHVPAAVALVLLAAADAVRVPLYAALGPPPVQPHQGEVMQNRRVAQLIKDELRMIYFSMSKRDRERLAIEARAARIRLDATQEGRADAQHRIDVATLIDDEKATATRRRQKEE